MDSSAFTASLRALAGEGASEEERVGLLDALLAELASSRLRDLEPDADMLLSLLSLPPVAWEAFGLEARCKVDTLVTGTLRLPEFVAAAPLAAPHISPEWLRAIFERAARPADATDVPAPPAGPTARGARCASSAPAQQQQQQQQLHSLGGVTVVSRGKSGAADLPAGSGSPTAAPGTAHLVELTAVRGLLHYAYRGGGAAVRAESRALLGTTLLTMASSIPPPRESNGRPNAADAHAATTHWRGPHCWRTL